MTDYKLVPVEGLRYTFDGALEECPCCGSLDVGGAHETVHFQSCGLTVSKPRPLQNAIDAWNMRTGRSHPAHAVQGEPVEVECRQCDNCDHIGIDDLSAASGACTDCEWQGPEQAEDKCPGCRKAGTMTAACPECGGRYVLRDYKTVSAPQPAGYNFADAMRLCSEGLNEWKAKAHNRRWWKRIDGTPIPNDLLCCIAEAFTADQPAQPAEQQPAPDVDELVEALKWLRGAINCTPENDKHQSGAWISTSHPRIRQIDELLATHRKGGDHV